MKTVFKNLEALTLVEQSAEESELGTYGEKWLKFMREHHPKLVLEMQSKGSLYKVAHSVDDMAWDYRDLLENQYAQTHPRPKEFYEVVAWERVRAFYTDSEVMRSKVLIPRSAV
jgi:hypothetical protein